MALDHSKQIRTASGINILLGLWLIASAWVYGMATPGIMWNSVIVGIVVAVLGALRFNSPHQSSTLSWINVALGVWTLLSPWIYGYTTNVGRLWNSVIVGVVVALLAIWSGSATVSEHRHAHA